MSYSTRSRSTTRWRALVGSQGRPSGEPGSARKRLADAEAMLRRYQTAIGRYRIDPTALIEEGRVVAQGWRYACEQVPNPLTVSVIVDHRRHTLDVDVVLLRVPIGQADPRLVPQVPDLVAVAGGRDPTDTVLPDRMENPGLRRAIRPTVAPSPTRSAQPAWNSSAISANEPHLHDTHRTHREPEPGPIRTGRRVCGHRDPCPAPVLRGPPPHLIGEQRAGVSRCRA